MLLYGMKKIRMPSIKEIQPQLVKTMLRRIPEMNAEMLIMVISRWWDNGSYLLFCAFLYLSQEDKHYFHRKKILLFKNEL